MIRYLFAKVKQKILPGLFTSSDMHSILKKEGIDVGKHTIFYNPGKTIIDVSRPCLLQIGDYCKITSGVTILTHDYSRSVLRRSHGEIIGEGRKTIIGDNVFVGVNSIILMGSCIGSNVIVGAGCVVCGTFPDGVVIAGNPATIIRTLDEHYLVMERRMLKDAEEFVFHFYTMNKRMPSIKELNPFFPLFLERNFDELSRNGISLKLGGDEEREIIRDFMKTNPIFNGYDKFIEHCKEKYSDKFNL